MGAFECNVFYFKHNHSTSLNFMVAAISPMLMQKFPGETEFSGADVIREYVFYLLEEREIISKEMSTAISIIFDFNEILNENPCTSGCYNVNIVMCSKEAPYDCYQIQYHFSGGAETMARCSEYKVDGLKTVEPSRSYHDRVNNRTYKLN